MDQFQNWVISMLRILSIQLTLSVLDHFTLYYDLTY